MLLWLGIRAVYGDLRIQSKTTADTCHRCCCSSRCQRFRLRCHLKWRLIPAFVVGRRPLVQVVELLLQLREAFEAPWLAKPVRLAAQEVASMLEGN